MRLRLTPAGCGEPLDIVKLQLWSGGAGRLKVRLRTPGLAHNTHPQSLIFFIKNSTSPYLPIAHPSLGSS